jgi:hypothetical protein
VKETKWCRKAEENSVVRRERNTV